MNKKTKDKIVYLVMVTDDDGCSRVDKAFKTEKKAWDYRADKGGIVVPVTLIK